MEKSNPVALLKAVAAVSGDSRPSEAPFTATCTSNYFYVYSRVFLRVLVKTPSLFDLMSHGYCRNRSILSAWRLKKERFRFGKQEPLLEYVLMIGTYLASSSISFSTAAWMPSAFLPPAVAKWG